MAIPERISVLLLKYLRGELSIAEKAELDEWKHSSGENMELFSRLTDPDGLRELLNEYYVSRDQVWDRIVARAPELADAEPSKRRWLRPALAAASVILIGAFIAVLWRNTHAYTKPIESVLSIAKTQDILPGTDKAVLTLADGKRVVLNNIEPGAIENSTMAMIVKQDSASVIYKTRLLDKTTETDQAAWNTLETPKGGQYQLILADGTHVWLNAASWISYPVVFGPNERGVTLSGEAYFEVCKDPSRPFRIRTTHDARIEVLGTHFNIMAYADETAVTTTLLEGKVKVYKDSGSTSVVLKPGQQAISGEGEQTVQTVADTGSIVSWKNGVTSFRNADIPAIMRKIQRWYDVDISYSGKLPQRSLVGGIPRNAKLSEVLKVLEFYDVHCRVEGKHITVSP